MGIPNTNSSLDTLKLQDWDKLHLSSQILRFIYSKLAARPLSLREIRARLSGLLRKATFNVSIQSREPSFVLWDYWFKICLQNAVTVPLPCQRHKENKQFPVCFAGVDPGTGDICSALVFVLLQTSGSCVGLSKANAYERVVLRAAAGTAYICCLIFWHLCFHSTLFCFVYLTHPQN